jgi:predicted protein tyrosine phosphatase
VRSAGTEAGARIKITNGHIGWADVIFVMEKKHLNRIKEKFRPIISEKEIWNLDIPDDYGYMDEDLIEILKARVSDYIDVPE